MHVNILMHSEEEMITELQLEFGNCFLVCFDFVHSLYYLIFLAILGLCAGTFIDETQCLSAPIQLVPPCVMQMAVLL